MANLETLELTITASAERAEQGVNVLIRSLSRLSDALVRPYSDLKDLNDELRTLARLGKMKLSLFDGAGKSAAKTASAAREAVKAAKEMARVQERAQQNIDKEPPPPIKQGDPRWHEKMLAVEAKRRAEREARYTNAINAYNEQQRQRQAAVDAEHANSRQRALRAASLLNEGNQAELLKNKLEAMATAYVSNAAAGKLTDEQMANGAIRIRQVYNRYVQLTQATNEQTESQRNLGETATQTGNRMEGLRNVFSRVARIAQTMLIRTALKSLLNGITKAWQGAYSFSKKMGGEFAKNVDRAQASLKSMATSVVRLLGPAMQAIAPVIKVVATAVSFLSDAIANLLKALGLTSELFGTSAEELASYEGSAGKAAKGILAGFDELNVIQNQSGGGSGSGGSSPLGDFVGEINNQLALLKVIIGESMLGIGLILMCSGHPAYGLALMVLGASSIASALTADWEKLPKDVKGTITGVMTVVAGASLALGAIIALTSPAHLGLGIALMAIGAANLAAVAAVNWSSMGNNVDEQISKIATIVGGALVALGAVIAFACPTHLGLGVALMAAGAASLATAAAISWGDASGNVKNQITVIAGIVGGAALAIGALLTFAGPGTQGIGIALMVAGAASIATAAALSWSDTTGKVKGEVTTILGIVGGAALVVGAILTFSGANVPLGIGLMAAGGASLATAVALNWDSITTKIKGVFTEATNWLADQWDKVKTAVSGAWEAVKEWWGNNISKPVEAAWKATVKYLTEKWDQIKGSVETAWTAVGNWWTDVKSKISKVWDKIKDYVTGVWSSISTGVSDAWAAVGDWWKDVKGKFSKVWEDAKTYVTGVWDSIGKGVTSAWDSVKKWFGDVKTNLEGAWEKAKKYITDVWTEIGKKVTSAWNSVVSWFGSIKARMEAVWEDAKNYITGVWDSIKTGVTNAWDNLKKWWENIKVKLSSVWEDAKTYITGVWDNIGTSVSSAWDSVAKWFGNIGSSLRAKWEEAKGYITGVWGNIKDSVSNAWKSVKNWWTTGVKANLEKKWKSAKKYIEGVWDSITKKVGGAWDSIKLWWANNISSKFFQAWVGAKDTVVRLWDDIKTGIGNAWDAIKQWWDQTTSGPIEMIKSAWLSVSSWFQTYVTQPIGQFFKDAVNVIIDAVNWMIDKLNSIGHIKFDGFKLLEIGSFKIEIPGVDLRMWQIPKIGRIAAEGAYGINSGELFIANEAGPELVGTMDGKTTVANQEQIVEGIRRGVYDAQSEQNALLRRQNELLTAILRKDASVRIGASSMLGRTVRQSLDMYEAAAGV